MNEAAPLKKASQSRKAGAGAAGAGSGTLLVLLANNLPERNPWRSWLVLLAPSLSIAITVAYAWGRKAIDEYLERRRVERFVREAKVTLKEALENRNTSETHRKKLRAQLEELELLLVKASIEKVRVVDTPGLPQS
jgi:hypothetical protein